MLLDSARNEPISKDMVRQAMGELYASNLRADRSVRESYVIQARLEENKELPKLIEKMRNQIEDLLAEI